AAGRRNAAKRGCHDPLRRHRIDKAICRRNNRHAGGYTWTFDKAVGNRIAHTGIETAAVAYTSAARRQHLLERVDGLRDEVRNGLRSVGDEILTPDRQVNVRINKPGQDRLPSNVDDLGLGGELFDWADRADPPVFDDEGLAMRRSRVGRIDDERIGQRESSHEVPSVSVWASDFPCPW